MLKEKQALKINENSYIFYIYQMNSKKKIQIYTNRKFYFRIYIYLFRRVILAFKLE